MSRELKEYESREYRKMLRDFFEAHKGDSEDEPWIEAEPVILGPEIVHTFKFPDGAAWMEMWRPTTELVEVQVFDWYKRVSIPVVEITWMAYVDHEMDSCGKTYVDRDREEFEGLWTE